MSFLILPCIFSSSFLGLILLACLCCANRGALTELSRINFERRGVCDVSYKIYCRELSRWTSFSYRENDAYTTRICLTFVLAASDVLVALFMRFIFLNFKAIALFFLTTTQYISAHMLNHCQLFHNAIFCWQLSICTRAKRFEARKTTFRQLNPCTNHYFHDIGEPPYTYSSCRHVLAPEFPVINFA